MNIQQIKRIIRSCFTGKASEQEQLLVDKWLQVRGQNVREPDKTESERREKIVLARLQTYIRIAGHPPSADGKTAAADGETAVADEASSFIGVTAATPRRIYVRRWTVVTTVILLAGILAIGVAKRMSDLWYQIPSF